MINFLKYKQPPHQFAWYSQLFAIFSPLAAALLLLFGSGAFDRIEQLTVDLRFRLRAPNDPSAHPRLVLVGIDEPSLESFGRWPWPRSKHGDLCTLLSTAEPRVVAFDLLFTEPSTKEEDAAFVSGAGKLPSLVMGAFSNPQAARLPPEASQRLALAQVSGDLSRLHSNPGALIPFPALTAISRFGFVDSDPTTSDGVRRRIPMVVNIDQHVYPSLALQTLMAYWKISPAQVKIQLGQAIELVTPEGPVTIPINDAGEMWINYRAPATFQTWSYVGLFRALYFDATGEKPFPKQQPPVKDSILIIGQTAVGLTDFGPSPLEASSPLVFAWVNALNTILQRDFLKVIPIWPWPFVCILLSGWLTLAFSQRGNVLRTMAVPALVVAAYLILSFLVFWKNSLVFPLAAPVIVFLLLHLGAILLRWVQEIFIRRQLSEELAVSEAAKKRLEQELEIAKQIQISILPMVFPAFPDRPEIDLHALMEPAKLVGGDLYDFFFIDDRRLFFVVGDVAGKGLPAALFMTMALSVIRAQAMEGLSPAEILRRANNVLAMRNERSTFVTTFCGFLDVSTGHVAYANGGHNPPAKLDGDGGVEFLEMGGIALGAMDGMSYEERELTLQPGQGLLLYTDGVNEATNAQDELFEDERLVSALQLPHRKMTAEMITANLRQKVAEFVLEAPPSDDITAVAILYRGPVKTGN